MRRWLVGNEILFIHLHVLPFHYHHTLRFALIFAGVRESSYFPLHSVVDQIKKIISQQNSGAVTRSQPLTHCLLAFDVLIDNLDWQATQNETPALMLQVEQALSDVLTSRIQESTE